MPKRLVKTRRVNGENWLIIRFDIYAMTLWSMAFTIATISLLYQQEWQGAIAMAISIPIVWLLVYVRTIVKRKPKTPQWIKWLISVK